MTEKSGKSELKTPFHSPKTGQLNEAVMRTIKKEYGDYSNHRTPFSFVDSILVSLKQVDLLEDLLDELRNIRQFFNERGSK
jgi:hypothetical protein